MSTDEPTAPLDDAASGTTSYPPAADGDAPDLTPLREPRDGVPTPLTTTAQTRDLARRLAADSGPVALDTERASGYRYGGRAFLVQLRCATTGTALIDTADRSDLVELAAPLAGPEWILHAASQDLPSLAELGLRPTRLFDTELAGRLAGFDRVNLAALVERMLGLQLAKGHGADDWSRRPLPRSWLVYAALDVEVLIELRDAIADRLRAEGKDSWAAQEFAHILDRRPNPPQPERWRRTTDIHTVKSTRGLAAVRELWTVREEIAARRDIAPGRILPDRAIVAAATAAPTSRDELIKLPVFSGPKQRRQAGTWFDALTRARELPESELPRRNRPSSGPPPFGRWENRNPDAAARADAVRPVIKEIAEQYRLPTENLLAPDLVRQLCWDGLAEVTDETVDAWLTEHGARPWQRSLVVAPIAEALARAA